MDDPSAICVRAAELDRPEDCRAILELLDLYARDPIGQNAPLADTVRGELIPGLRAHPTQRVWLAWSGDRPVGIAVCFEGYSTFQARPLLNLHDLAVHPRYRRRGIGRALLAAVEAAARQTGCCKLTLEVRGDNAPAQRLYRQAGFAGDGCGSGYGFWTKDLRSVAPG